jgi:hypothetical protein
MCTVLSLQIVTNFVIENYALLSYYAASSGNSLPTFQDNLSVPSSRVMMEDGTNRLFRNVGKELPLCYVITQKSTFPIYFVAEV